MIKERFFLLYFFLVQFCFLIQLEKSCSQFYRHAENQSCARSGERVSLAIVRCVVEDVRCFFEWWQMKRWVGDIGQADSRTSKYWNGNSKSAFYRKLTWPSVSHIISQHHQMTSVNMNAVVAHRICHFVDNRASRRFDSKNFKNFWNMIRRRSTPVDSWINIAWVYRSSFTSCSQNAA